MFVRILLNSKVIVGRGCFFTSTTQHGIHVTADNLIQLHDIRTNAYNRSTEQLKYRGAEITENYHVFTMSIAVGIEKLLRHG